AGETNLRNYIAGAVKNRNDQKEYPFIVFDKKNNAYAGSTRFYDIQQTYQTVQLGYTWYGQKFQRTGLNRHCKLLLLGFAFEEWGMERVEFRAHAGNARSIAAMKAIGCIEEGILRSHMPTVDGTRRNSIVLSILKSEWNKGGKELLIKRIH
ncbi:MAG: GNAT family N-acetyltransferase, partial [Bacteroidia bacterium]|nr:GNAT family N-acetyltransferase [Bacteroidia bacterium]